MIKIQCLHALIYELFWCKSMTALPLAGEDAIVSPCQKHTANRNVLNLFLFRACLLFLCHARIMTKTRYSNTNKHTQTPSGNQAKVSMVSALNKLKFGCAASRGSDSPRTRLYTCGAPLRQAPALGTQHQFGVE